MQTCSGQVLTIRGRLAKWGRRCHIEYDEGRKPLLVHGPIGTHSVMDVLYSIGDINCRWCQ